MYDSHTNEENAALAIIEKRRHKRMALNGMSADISDGRGFFTGKVRDISRYGLALDDIPSQMNPHSEYLTIIIDGQGGHFKLKVRPRWETTTGNQKSIGGQIENTSFAWTEFVMRYEPEKNDIWGDW